MNIFIIHYSYKEIMILTEKIESLKRSRQQTIKEMELLRKEISILQDIVS
jgi:hypothetical protein